jgi:antirestriction protein ArdC
MQESPNMTISGRCFYRPSADVIGMPMINAFDQPAEYYSSLFHEMGHWTGASHRLNRSGVAKNDGFGTEQYSKEELIAEMTAAFLCDLNGIGQAVIVNQAAYIGGWLKKLKDDKKLVVEAAQAAQKAAAYITRGIDQQPETETETETEPAAPAAA